MTRCMVLGKINKNQAKGLGAFSTKEEVDGAILGYMRKDYRDWFKENNWEVSDHIHHLKDLNPNEIAVVIEKEIDDYIRQEKEDEDVDRFRENPECYL
jgi:hypothetical protein